MALTASLVYECMNNATAGNVNGGGFDSSYGGTDYTQQTTAQLALTDLASTLASGWLTLTSATGGFTAAMVGNIVHIASGTNFTAGWYLITVFTNTNTVTVDRACGATADASAGVGKVGGAMSLNSTLDDDFFEILLAGNKVWMKNNGTYTLAENISVTADGGAQNPIIIEGYITTRGDVPTGSNRPVMAGAGYTMFFGDYVEFYNLRFTTTITNGLQPGAYNKIVNCKATNTSTSAGRVGITPGGLDVLINTESISYRGNALGSGNVSFVCLGCYFHDSNNGISSQATSAFNIINCLIESNVNAAINLSGALTNSLIIGNTLYGSEAKTGTGIIIATGTFARFLVMDNIIYGFTTGISHADAQNGGYDNYNDFFNNTTDVSNWTKGANDQALNPTFTTMAQVTGTTATYAGSILTQTGADFSNVVDNQDFIYIKSGTGITVGQYLITAHTTTTVTTDLDAGENVAGDINFQVTTGRNFAIGLNLKAKGFPAAFQAGLTTGYTDIGAVQRQESVTSRIGGLVV